MRELRSSFFFMRGALRTSVFVALTALLCNGLVEQTATLSSSSSSSSPTFSSLLKTIDGVSHYLNR